MSTRISLYDLESMYDKKMMMTKTKAGRREGGQRRVVVVVRPVAAGRCHQMEGLCTYLGTWGN
jgi:hypothetical protein